MKKPIERAAHLTNKCPLSNDTLAVFARTPFRDVEGPVAQEAGVKRETLFPISTSNASRDILRGFSRGGWGDLVR